MIITRSAAVIWVLCQYSVHVSFFRCPVLTKVATCLSAGVPEPCVDGVRQEAGHHGCLARVAEGTQVRLIALVQALQT